MRITGGVFRSRTLNAPHGQETRPTSDRVREAIFSMLASDGVFAEELDADELDADEVNEHAERAKGARGARGARGPRVLDLYAGSGALGLEAISRGARAAVLVESGRPALIAIRENVRALDVADEVTVIASRVERALDKIEGPFDLVLVDPPYADVRTTPFTEVLEKVAQLLAPAGVLALEHAAADEPSPPTGLVLDRRRRHGDTTVSLFRHADWNDA